MRILVLILILINITFANSENIALVNQIKSLIQKEEYISLAINKYISQTKSIPRKSDNSLDWDKLKVDDYLGANFDKKNPFTNNDLVVTFDTNNNCFIKGILEVDTAYNVSKNYLYNFYTNKTFRVNTLAPQDISKIKLFIGSQVIYGKLQEEIRKNLKAGNKIFFDSETCTYDVVDTTKNYFYELKNQELTYKYCKGTYSFEVYQESPIYLEDSSDLPFVKAKIGDIAYVQKNGEWFEYYYQGRVGTPWIPVSEGEKFINQQKETQTYQEKVSSYIPNAKDLVIRRSGGCMLSNGDIYCWGNNSNKKVGISNYGQIDNTLKADFINTPVMLKTQIDNVKIGTTTYDIKTKKWYNSPYRVKFDKMSMNSTNVCGITKIFEYTEGTTVYKFGGDLYCNGSINSTYYEDLDASVKESSILKRNKSVYTNKSTKIKSTSAKYLVDIAMVEDVIAVLDDTGKIYTIGKNYKGSLGVGKDDNFYFVNIPTLVNADSNIVFKKIFALRDTRTFGAIDSNNLFYIWGERNGTIYNKPTLLSSIKFNPDAIFINNNEFILRDLNKNYYKTTGTLSVQSISSTAFSGEPISISYYKDNNNKEYLLYIDENLKLHSSTLSTSSLLTCKEADEISSCITESNKIFDDSINFLNTTNNNISDKFANFTNVSIFKLDHVIKEISEDFENLKPEANWSNYKIAYGGPEIGGFLGMFTGYNKYSSLPDKYDGTIRSFDFGVQNANQEVKITFDFYEIDSWGNDSWENGSWENEYFRVFANGVQVFSKQYYSDTVLNKSAEGGIAIEIASSMVDGSYSNWYHDEKHEITITTNLDSNGKLQLKFTSTLDENILNESWGIDNLKVEKKSNGEVLSFEDFNNLTDNGWGRNIITYGGKGIGNILGPFTGYYPYTKFNGYTRSLYGDKGEYDGTAKTFDFGTSNANQNVTVSFDFYEIDGCNGDVFKVYSNGSEVFSKAYYTDSYYSTDYDGGTKVEIQGSSPEGSYYNWYHDEKHFITFNTKLDSNGKIKLEFFANFDTYILEESWALDNLTIKKDSTGETLAFENFEGEYEWSNNIITTIPDNGDTTQVPATTFLGRFPIVDCQAGSTSCAEKPYSVTKKYSFGSFYANYEVDIEFDFYEIDSWDGERFEFYANDELLAVDNFVMDGQQHVKDSNITGINLQDNIRLETEYTQDQTYRYKLRTRLDSKGEVNLKFQTNLEKDNPIYANEWSDKWYDNGTIEDVNNESWGIDNIKVKLRETNKKFVCAMTGVETASQMYCWGNVARSLPILSTSLYDVSKITTINKLFISQDSEKSNQMSYDEFFNDGKLFLKYPTYIGGFDYPFYFR